MEYGIRERRAKSCGVGLCCAWQHSDTAFLLAAGSGHVDVMKHLIYRGAAVNVARAQVALHT